SCFLGSGHFAASGGAELLSRSASHIRRGWLPSIATVQHTPEFSDLRVYLSFLGLESPDPCFYDLGSECLRHRSLIFRCITFVCQVCRHSLKLRCNIWHRIRFSEYVWS